jgi:hypothetical protein
MVLENRRDMRQHAPEYRIEVLAENHQEIRLNIYKFKQTRDISSIGSIVPVEKFGADPTSYKCCNN